MLLAAALLAATVVGPELTPPPEPTEPARGTGAAVAALSGGNFVALWVDNRLVAAQAIAGAPLRKKAAIVGSVPVTGPPRSEPLRSATASSLCGRERAASRGRSSTRARRCSLEAMSS